jgi:acetylornithine deacetylase/succinyl-diaminopimelate desuccinylase-like protein
MDSLEAAMDHAQRHYEQHLEELISFLSIPSISALPQHEEDIQRAAQWLVSELQRLKMENVQVMPTGGHPVVYGEWLKAPGKPTVLVYGHYDVQPADPLDEWLSPPFAPEVRGDYLFARGASDMKGQIFAQLKAMEALCAQGDYPVNIKYLLEGEEEIGSPHLADFIDEHRELLACDIVVNCDSCILAPDKPAIIYAIRGLAYYELEVCGPQTDLHSGRYGGSIENPIHVLCRVLADMHAEDGHITLPGFYDKVRDLSPEDRAELGAVSFSDETWLKSCGSPAVCGEKGYTTVERLGARPSLDVNGIWGGFSEEGAKTVLPARASAKLSMRLVADQRSDEVLGQLQAYLMEHMPSTVTWSVKELSHGPGAIMDRNSPYMQCARDALETVFGKEPLFFREGYSVPVVGMMQDKLGVESIMLGFALPDDGIHGPNERQYLPNTVKGIETYIRFMAML